MPELPEIETIRRDLAPQLMGRTITAVCIHPGAERLAVTDPPRTLERRLRGRRIEALERHGKYLLARLDDGRTWVLHLRMTGSLTLAERGAPAGHFERARVELDDGRVLRLDDMRKFATWHLVDDPSEAMPRSGPDALAPEFTAARLSELLRGRSASLKAALLDQRVAAGVGNIYADEACWIAGIDPRTPAGRVGPRRAQRLHAALLQTLEDANRGSRIELLGLPGWARRARAAPGALARLSPRWPALRTLRRRDRESTAGGPRHAPLPALPAAVNALLTAFGLVFVAELGDKSMLLELVLTPRYGAWRVLLAIALETMAVMALAVLAGGLAGQLLPEAAVAVVAGLLFIAFGVWAWLDSGGDDALEDQRQRSGLVVIGALAVTLFVSELGDKTQLATLSLSGLNADARFAVWVGAVLGMVAADAAAMLAGARLLRAVPRRLLARSAGALFVLFGLAAIGLGVR